MPSRRSDFGDARDAGDAAAARRPRRRRSASTCTYIVSEPRSRAVRLSGVSTATTRPLLMMTTRWQVCDDLGQDVRAEDDRVIAGELLDQLARFDDLLRVEAGGRLVEDQHVGVVDERLGEADALLVAFRELARTSRSAMSAMRVRSITVLDALRAGPPTGRPLIFATKSRYSDDGHVGVERRRFRQVAGAPLGFDRLVEDVEAGDDRFALGGRHVAGQDAHRRRLAGAVGAEEAEDLAALDAEADVVDGGDAAVAFREVLNLDHRELLSTDAKAPVSAAPTKMLTRTASKCVGAARTLSPM